MLFVCVPFPALVSLSLYVSLCPSSALVLPLYLYDDPMRRGAWVQHFLEWISKGTSELSPRSARGTGYPYRVRSQRMMALVSADCALLCAERSLRVA